MSRPSSPADSTSSLMVARSTSPGPPNFAEPQESSTVVNGELHLMHSMADRLVHFLNSIDISDAIDFVARGVIDWIQREPRAASRFAVNGAGIFMRALSLRISEIDDDHLPSVVRAFVDSIPVVCDHLINEDGFLNLLHLDTTTSVLAGLEPDFWYTHPYIQCYLVGYFQILATFVKLIGDIVARDARPIRGGQRRGVALDIIFRIFRIISDAGDVGRRFMNEDGLWKDAAILWVSARNCSILHEYKVARIFLHAFEFFNPSPSADFSTRVIYALQEYGYSAEDILTVAFRRLHRAGSSSSGEQGDSLTTEQLLVIRSLVESEDFEFDDSPIHRAFLTKNGFRYMLEVLSYCVGDKRWNSVTICLSLIIRLISQARTPEIFAIAFQEGLIKRFMEVSCHTEISNSIGHSDLSCFLKGRFTEILFMPRIAELAVELQWEALATLSSSEFHRDWLRLIRLRERFRKAYTDAAQAAGEVFRQCGNPSCNSIDLDNTRHKKCAHCELQHYCCRVCERLGWRYGHEAICAGLLRARDELRSSMKDIRLFMLLVQHEVQQYVTANRITLAGNNLGFRVCYGGIVTNSAGRRLYDLVISEFVPAETRRDVVMTVLPSSWTGSRYSDFQATVEVVFTRNYEECKFTFSCGFQFGYGPPETSDDEEDKANVGSKSEEEEMDDGEEGNDDGEETEAGETGEVHE